MQCELLDIEFSYARAERKTLSQLSYRFKAACFYGIYGANGSGKSSLLKIISRELTPQQGQCKPKLPFAERARRIALMEQELPSRIPLSVREIVELGRYAWRQEKDAPEAVETALAALDLTHLQQRGYNLLSGGEKQRVMLARMLAQDCPLMLLDEPTSSLDLKHQLDFYKTMRQKASQEGKCVIMVSQDLFLAPRFLDQILFFKEGRLLFSGSPRQVLKPENIKSVYDCELENEMLDLCGGEIQER